VYFDGDLPARDERPTATRRRRIVAMDATPDTPAAASSATNHIANIRKQITNAATVQPITP